MRSDKEEEEEDVVVVVEDDNKRDNFTVRRISLRSLLEKRMLASETRRRRYSRDTGQMEVAAAVAGLLLGIEAEKDGKSKSG